MAKGKKTGGRVKGTPNRLTKEIREILKNLIFTELENFQTYFDELEPKEKMEIVYKLMPYVLPKVKDISHDNNEPIDFGFRML